MKAAMLKIIKGISGIFGDLKIQTKLLVCFGTVFVLFIVFIIAVFYLTSVSILKIEAVNYSSLYIRQLNENLNTYANELERLTLMTYADTHVQSILSKDIKSETSIEQKNNTDYIENFLFNIYSLKPDIINITLIGENGMMYSEGITRYSTPMDDRSKYDWYAEAVANPARLLVYTDLKNENSLDTLRGEKTVSVIKQIRNTELDRLVGVVRIDVQYDKVMDLVKRAGKSSSMEIVILNKGYGIVFDPYDTVKTLNIPRFADVFKKILDEKNGSIQANIKEGSQTVVFSTSSYTGWIAIGIISNEILFEKATNVRNFSIAAAVVSVIVIVIICMLIAMGITNPLKRLRVSMKKFADGDFDVKVNPAFKDEIGDIGRSFNKMVVKIKELINREYFLEIKGKEAELKALQAQINPHFLYNTLEALRMKAVVNGDRDAAEMAKKLSKFFRLNIIGGSEVVKIREELEHVSYYLDIQNIRYNNRFTYVEDVEENVLDARILKLTLQPLIENAIFHGLEPKVGQCLIILRGRMQENSIIIEIIDNGVGMGGTELNGLKEALENTSASNNLGLGILNVHNRIKYHFGEEYGLNITSEPDKGTIVEIHIPYTE